MILLINILSIAIYYITNQTNKTNKYNRILKTTNNVTQIIFFLTFSLASVLLRGKVFE